MTASRYFEFVESIRWFKAVGLSESNTWIGSSRMIDTVHVPSRTESGDVLHVVPSGTFLVRKDGSVESGRLRLRKPAFEKSYGGYLSDEEIGARMAMCGRCRVVEAPAAKPDYSAARKAVEANRMPECKGQLLRGEVPHTHSPILQDIFSACYSADLGGAVGAAGAKWVYADVGCGAEPDSTDCSVIVRLPDGDKVEIVGTPLSREVWIKDSTRAFGPALRDGGAEKFEIEGIEYRNEVVTIVHEDQLYSAVEAIAEFLREGRISKPEAAALG